LTGTSVAAARSANAIDPRRVDLLIFDCDGVLVDSEPIAARIASECFAELGIAISPAAMIARFAGVSGPKVTDLLLAENGRSEDATARAEITAARGRRIVAALERELRPMPGIAPALATLALPRCVASSSRLDRIGRSLEVTGLAGFFGAAVFSAEQVARGKPAPDLFQFAAERMGVSPDRCLVIEDSPFGVTAGRAAGMQVLGFVGGGHCSPDHPAILRAAGADQIIAAMDELTAVLT